MIDIVNEQMIPLSKVPAWCGKHIGHRVNRSTVHRWELRGARGNKLETVLIAGRRYTSLKALLRFFDDTTAAEALSDMLISARDRSKMPAIRDFLTTAMLACRGLPEVKGLLRCFQDISLASV